MDYILLISLLCCIVLISIIIYKSKQYKKYTEETTKHIENLTKSKRDELKEYFKEETNEFEIKRAELKGELSKIQCVLAEKESRYQEVNQDLETYKKDRIKEIDSAGAEYEKRKRLEKAKAIEEHNNSMKKASAELQEQLKRAEDVLRNQIEEIKTELEEERSKRAAINEEILRQRALDEQQDFYRIRLDPNDKDDVEILRSVAPRLRHPEAVNKVIWSAYYQKPLAELRKRVAVESSGVYKITRIKTGEIYIGQAVNVSTRWADHVKSALGVGTLTSSQLHRIMFEDGPENFTFELLEEVSKDKLRERESYYIDFYDSKTYGLNTLSGDKNK